MPQSVRHKTPAAPRPRLSGLVGNGQANSVFDILWTKDALQTLGRYNDPGERHGFIDKELDDAIQGFQRDRGLKSDGLLKPRGETERAIREDLKQIAAGKPAKTSDDQGVKDRSDPRQKLKSPPTTDSKLPILTMPDERRQSILDNTPARFKFTPDPDADASDTIGALDFLGRRAVKKHNATIDKMAKKHNVDPDMIRAIMYSENARGHKIGINIIADRLGKAESVMPMNINPKM